MKIEELIRLIDKFDEAAQNHGYFAEEGSVEDAVSTEKTHDVARKELIDKLVEAGVSEVKKGEPIPPPTFKMPRRKINW